MVQIEVTEGILEGEKVENEFGGSYFSFKGIPYAEPPIGDLRFKAPVPKKPWPGIRSAKEHGPICYQYDALLQMPPSGSEDCLYLNVYTPDIHSKKPLPVMFWIHGGGFISGSGNSQVYGPEFLVKHDVILVTINYRLEALGFLCLHTEDIPGNAGMKDQVAALRWVKDNISNFGGDPENITIFGESAGGASVTFHLISPMTKGLFKKAIAQSGAATNVWAFAFQPRERAKALARKLGCDSDDDKVLYEFFKSQPVESLIKVEVPVTLIEEAQILKDAQFGVVSEQTFNDSEIFFHGNPYDTVREGIHEGVDVIAGFCEDEGILGFARGVSIEKVISHTNSYPEIFAPREIAMNCPIDTVMEVGRLFKQYYFGDKRLSIENLDSWVKALSMGMFKYGIYQWQKFSSIKNRVYMYNFSCKTERNWLSRVLGANKYLGDKIFVGHADDLAYIFPMKVISGKVDKNSEAFQLIQNVTKLWTNFAKTGDPTPDFALGVEWPPYEIEYQAFLKIGNELSLGALKSRHELPFWENIFSQYLPRFVFDSN